jgi:alkyl hydroperoxide reductase subunit F
MYDIIIVGAGPAGLSASVYAARKQLKAMLISEDIGGQINNTLGIENYLGYQFIEGPELIDKFTTQLDSFPIEQEIGVKVSRIDKLHNSFRVITQDGDKYKSRAVIYTAGKKSRKLNVPGEDEFTGRGVSYCAICDGPVFIKQRVVVIGGGNSALEAVLDLVKIAKHVTMVSLTQLTGDKILVDQLEKTKKLDIFLEYQTLEIEGNAFVNGIVIKDLKSQQIKNIRVGGIFIEIGMVPNSEPVKQLVKLNKYGEIPINCTGETKIPGLFAAGDVTDVSEKQIVVAAGEGAKASLQAHRYLQHLAK